MSRILSRISMFDRADLVARLARSCTTRSPRRVMRSNSELADDRDLGVDADAAATPVGWPVAAITSPVLSTISRGSSGLPVAWAGHTDVQRPHIVQASVSSSCFHVKSSTTDAPNDSSAVSVRLGIGFIAPLGRSRSRRYMFSGDVNMCRSIVIGRITRKTKNATTWVTHMIWCQRVERVERQPVDQRGERVADEAPLLEVGRALRGDAEHLGDEAGDADDDEHAEDDGVLGLGLDADAVRAAARSGARSPRRCRRGRRAPARSPTNE